MKCLKKTFNTGTGTYLFMQFFLISTHDVVRSYFRHLICSLKNIFLWSRSRLEVTAPVSEKEYIPGSGLRVDTLVDANWRQRVENCVIWRTARRRRWRGIHHGNFSNKYLAHNNNSHLDVVLCHGWEDVGQESGKDCGAEECVVRI